MTHVSKFKLEHSVEKRLIKSFMDALLSTSAKKGRARVNAILTKTEKVMLAKRLAIIVMLDRGDSYYKIESSLNVSGSTVKRLHRLQESGIFDPLTRVFGRDLSFLDYLEIFMSAGMPAIGGPRHQRHLDAIRGGRKQK
jgi:uncharacterized protein YerC